jgi:hypothetical protein
VSGFWPSAIRAAAEAPPALTAGAVAALLAFGLRCAIRMRVDRDRGGAVAAGRVAGAALALALGASLLPVALAALPRVAGVLVAPPLTVGAVLITAALPWRAGVLSAAAPPVVAAASGLLAALLLLPAGLFVAAPGRPPAGAELTGESRRETVRFRPPGLPPREEGFRAHHVVLRDASGVALGEGFVFGGAFRARGALRGGVLLELDLLENDGDGRGYPPHRAPVQALGPARLPGYWRRARATALSAFGFLPVAWVSEPVRLVDADGLAARGNRPLTPAP